MTEQYPQGIWDASEYFEHLTATNRLAKRERFTFCHVSGLDGFEEALAHMQRTTAFVCVSVTGTLLASPKALQLRADGRFFEVGLSQSFLEICD